MDQPSGEYTWPIRAVWLTFALVFFAAGVPKLSHAGLEWVLSENMSILLLHHFYHISEGREPMVCWGLALAQYGWLTRLLAAGTVMLEISYPLTLFSSKAR